MESVRWTKRDWSAHVGQPLQHSNRYHKILEVGDHWFVTGLIKRLEAHRGTAASVLEWLMGWHNSIAVKLGKASVATEFVTWMHPEVALDVNKA